MEMGHHVIGIMKGNIKASVGENNAGESSHRKDKNKPNGEEHGGWKPEGASPHGGQPTEDFNPCRNGNNHGGDGKIGSGMDVKAHGKHVVGPDHKAEESNRHHGVHHA